MAGPGVMAPTGSTPEVQANQAGMSAPTMGESPALKFWRENGTMPTFLSLQIMSTKAQLEQELGRPANRTEVLDRLYTRDMGEHASDFTI